MSYKKFLFLFFSTVHSFASYAMMTESPLESQQAIIQAYRILSQHYLNVEPTWKNCEPLDDAIVDANAPMNENDFAEPVITIDEHAEFFGILPNEVFERIIKYLSYRDLCAFRVTSKRHVLLCDGLSGYKPWSELYVSVYGEPKTLKDLNWFEQCEHLFTCAVRFIRGEKQWDAMCWRERLVSANANYVRTHHKLQKGHGTYLQGACFLGEDLSKCDLSNANLRFANFMYAVVASKFDLTHGGRVSAVRLANANVPPLHFNVLCLKGADLSGACFVRAHGYDKRGWFLVTLSWLRDQGAVWDEDKPPRI